MGRDRPTKERDSTPPASTFLRGLTVGALVGAAIAGSVLVGRRRRQARPGPASGSGDRHVSSDTS